MAHATIQHISYAKSKSYATMRREDPTFVPPTSIHAKDTIARLGNGALAGAEKRQRDDRMDEDEREPKREKTADEDDDDGEEMEIEDDEDSGGKQATKGKNPGTSCDIVLSLCLARANIALNPFSVRRGSRSSATTFRTFVVYKSTSRSHG